MKANVMTLAEAAPARPGYREFFKRPVKVFDTVVISDLHLGSKICRAEELCRFLTETRCRRLIINGDVFDSINMKRLSKKHWKVLTLLRKLTAKKRGTEVIWIRGNHDGAADFISGLIGIRFRDEFRFTWNGKRVLVFHGDVFDKFVTRWPRFSDIMDTLYRMILLGPGTKRLGMWLKRASKTFIRNQGKVQAGAVRHAARRRADIVICGHTHHHEEHPAEQGVAYYNSGSWTGEQAHFIGMTGDEVRVVPYG